MIKKDVMYQKIVEAYKKTSSVKKVSKMLNTNVIKVRRVLITEGLWQSETSCKVNQLLNSGYSAEKAAEKLCMSIKNVYSYKTYDI